jgi:transcriptional regulator with XRE-family HTH domain
LATNENCAPNGLGLQSGNELTMLDNQVVTRIAQKIRSVRLERNLTIQQLANRMQVSKGLISKIENLKTIPSLPVFVTLIQSLDISLKEFFEDVVLANGTGYLVVRKAQHTLTEQKDNEGLTYHHILSQNIRSCVLQIFQLSIEPQSKGKSTTSNGYSYHFVLVGSCEFQISGEVFLLGEGDSIYLDASHPHILCNKAAMKLQVLSMNFILTDK